MNIFGQGLNTWNNLDNQSGRHATETAKASAGTHITAASASSAAGTDSAVSLQTGQVFRGEILNITSGDVTILLDNQQTINAKLGETMELNIGQRMYFEVKENQGEQVFIRPLPDMNVDSQTMAAEKALAANGFSFTERNLMIANSLMEAGMPLDKESMRKLMQQLVRVPEADIKQLAAMNRLELPVNAMTVRQFALYTSHEHQLTQAMNQVLDGLETTLAGMAADGNTEQIQSMNQQILDIFGWSGTGIPDGEGIVNETLNPVMDAGTNPDENGTINTASDKSGTVIGTVIGTVAEAADTNTTTVMNGIGNEKTEMDTVTSGGWNPNENPVKDEAASATGKENESKTVMEGRRSESLQVEQPAVSQSGSTGTIKTNSLLEALRTQLREMGIPEDTLQRLTKETKGSGELLSNISNYLAQEGVVTPHALRSFFQSDTYRKLVKSGIQEEWLMKPEQMKEPREIDRLYEKIQRQSEQLEQSFSQSGHSHQEFSGHSQNMRENIQFMQQLNQQFIFAQLPMKINGQQANSELFVYANKKKLQQGADGLKVLLHLDMPNLGNTDILVRLKDHMLHAKFTLEDQTSVTVVAENMQALAEKLEEKGFHFTNEVLKTVPKSEENSASGELPPDAVVEEMFNQDLVTGIKRYTFDMRT